MEATEERGGMLAVDNTILLWAFRYALGRSTYAVSDVAGAIRSNLGRIPDNDCQLMVREIDEAIRTDTAGMSMDARVWADVRNHLQAQLGHDDSADLADTAGKVRLSGHELVGEGAAFHRAGSPKRWTKVRPGGSTAGVGSAKCSCGVYSPPFTSGGRRKQWHREHKDQIRGQR